MEQPAQLSIIRTDNTIRFRLDLPDGPVGQEYSTDLVIEIRERLRRHLQAVTQSVPLMALPEMKRQTTKLGTVNDALLSLGRYLFETLLPTPLQEELHRLDLPLIISTNTPDIPWELMYDSHVRPGHYLCQANSIGRQIYHTREWEQSVSFADRSSRKWGKKESQGLSILFLVNPTSERTSAEEDVASLCTSLP